MLQLPENNQNYCTCKEQHNEFNHKEVGRLSLTVIFCGCWEGLKRNRVVSGVVAVGYVVWDIPEALAEVLVEV